MYRTAGAAVSAPLRERDWWTDALTQANAERDAATARAERAERTARLLLAGQQEVDRQRAETEAVTRAEVEAALDELRTRAEKAEAQAAYWHRRTEAAWEQGDKLANDLVAAMFGADGDREEFRQKWAAIAALKDPETERRFVLADGTESEFDPHQEDGCGCRQESRQLHVGPWRPVFATGGVVGSGAGPVLESGCTYMLPSRAAVEQQVGAHAHAKWAESKAARMASPEAQAGYDDVAEREARVGRFQLRRRAPEESRAWLVETRDRHIADGTPAEVIDAMIEATYERPEPS